MEFCIFLILPLPSLSASIYMLDKTNSGSMLSISESFLVSEMGKKRVFWGGGLIWYDFLSRKPNSKVMVIWGGVRGFGLNSALKL